MALKILKFLEDSDISHHLKEDELKQIAEDCTLGYEIDKRSRSAWESKMEEALLFAKQILTPKNFPWPDASNVIFPVITVAAVTFASRVAVEVIQDSHIVKIGTHGKDPDGAKKAKADRVVDHMSYQLLCQSDTWEVDLDRLLHILPLVGVCYRKVYYDPIEGLPKSDFCNPKDIIVNHNVPSLKDADRITHRFYVNKNYVIERIRAGHFNQDFDTDKLSPTAGTPGRMITDPDDSSMYSYSSEKDSETYEFLEQHCYLDLDDDGYKEPYIVILHKESGQIAGIYPRYDINSIEVNEKEQVVRIKADQYFVDFHFLPSPDGGFHSLGYGHLLYPLNKAINTLLNQLIDSGTLSNSQSGVIGRQLKIKGGNLKMQMGELVPVDAGTTGRVADNVFLFPFKEPSPVLFQLLGLLIESCKEIASINDVLTGQAQPQNSPASTVFELSSNGLKTFSNIFKRVTRSFKKEFQLLYNLNGKYLDPQEYIDYHDDPQASVEDYRDYKMDISPVADPNMSAESQRLANSQAISLLAQNPAILQSLNIQELVKEFFESLRIPQEKIEKLTTPVQQGPSPEMMKLQLEQQKLQQSGQVDQLKAQNDAKQTEIEQLKAFIKSKEAEAKVKKMEADAYSKMVDAQQNKEFKDRELDIQERSLDVQEKKIHADLHNTRMKANTDVHKEKIKAESKPKKVND